MKLKVVIRLKNGVLDPQARSILAALNAKGFDKVAGVSLAKEILLDFGEANISSETAFKQARQMCESLLANPVIEEFEIAECCK